MTNQDARKELKEMLEYQIRQRELQREKEYVPTREKIFRRSF
jgi:hypothetical protein